MLAQDVLQAIATDLNGSASIRAQLPAMRTRHPGVTFSCCDASDMSGEEPYLAQAAFNIYLINSDGHCWHMTGDPEHATGVVIAEKAVKK